MDFLANFHPIVIHFPIAVLLLYVLFEVVGILFNKDLFLKTAHILLALGVVAAVVAVLTGHQAADVAGKMIKEGANIPKDLIETHEEYATITLWFFVGVLVLRTFLVVKKKFEGFYRYIFILFAIIGSFLIYETGDHGGDLVYDYGTGTELLKKDINTNSTNTNE